MQRLTARNSKVTQRHDPDRDHVPDVTRFISPVLTRVGGRGHAAAPG
jgi:hypothetical protein